MPYGAYTVIEVIEPKELWARRDLRVRLRCACGRETTTYEFNARTLGSCTHQPRRVHVEHIGHVHKLMVNGYGVASWTETERKDARAYAEEVARVLREALGMATSRKHGKR